MSDRRPRGQPYAALDASALRSYGHSHDMPLWWGMAGLITIECVVFSTLIASYFYLGFRQPEWPLPGVKDPELLLPTIGTLVLFASSWFVHRADKAVDSEELGRMTAYLAASIPPALVFVGLKIYEYAGKEFRWDSHPYGSIVWLMIAFHFTHVVSVVLKTTVLVVLARRRFFHSSNRLALKVNGLYWHFVVVIWLPLYTVIYLSPRLS
jgi:cytochrome c oxidase subunit III